MSCVVVVFSNVAVGISFQRVTIVLAMFLVGNRVSMGPLWLAAQLDATHFQYWKLHLVTRGVYMGSVSPVTW